MGVSTAPGHTALTRMPSAAWSLASDCVRVPTPPFEAAYDTMPTRPRSPAKELRLTIDPPPPRRMCGMAARHPRNTPVRFTSSTWRHCSRLVSSARPMPRTPALLTSTSMPPEVATTVSNALSQCSSVVTSTSSTGWPAGGSVPGNTADQTVAPSAASRSTVAPPIEPSAPLTSATLPSNLRIVASSECPEWSVGSPTRAAGQWIPAPDRSPGQAPGSGSGTCLRRNDEERGPRCGSAGGRLRCPDAGLSAARCRR